MASSGWAKNKKGFMVNPQGKTARQMRQEKYATKKADAKASGGGGSGGGGGEAMTTTKPASKGSDEATQKTKKPSDMSAREMQKEYDGIEKKQANLQDKLIDAGFGRVTISEMKRRRNENPLFKEYSELSDRKTELTLEARVRGGPGFQVRDLTSKHRNPYAKKPPAKPASKGSEAIDPSRYLESNTSKTINTAYRVNKFDIDTVSSRKKAGDFDVEGDARKIASASGVTTNLPLVAMRQDKKIEVVAGDREFYANKRAQELNYYQDMVSGVFLKSSQIKGALSQKSVFKDHEGDFTVKSGQFSRVDTADIESSIKQPSKKVLDAQVKALLDTGDVGNVIPVILQRVGKKSAVNQRYKVVSGHDSFLAMRELKRRNPNYEMTNAFILD